MIVYTEKYRLKKQKKHLLRTTKHCFYKFVGRVYTQKVEGDIGGLGGGGRKSIPSVWNNSASQTRIMTTSEHGFVEITKCSETKQTLFWKHLERVINV